MLRISNAFSSFLKSFCIVCIISMSMPAKAQASLSAGCLAAVGVVMGFTSLMICCQNCLPDNSPLLPGERRESSGNFSGSPLEKEENERKPFLSGQPKSPRGYGSSEEDNEYL